MADAPNTATFLTRVDERTASDLPNSLMLIGSSTIGLASIGGGQYQMSVIGKVGNLKDLSANGFVSFNNSTGTFAPITLTSNGTLGITNPTGLGGNPVFSVTPNTTNQKVQARLNNTLYSTRKALSFIPGDNIEIAIVDNATDDCADIHLSASGGGGGGAPTDAYYLTTQANGNLSNEVNLGSKTTGIPYSTVASGASTVSIIDNGTANFVLTSNGAGSAPSFKAAGSPTLGPTLTTVAALTIAAGDMLVGSGTNAMTNLAKGGNGQYMRVSGSGVIEWGALPGILPALSSVTGTTAGSLLVGTGSGTFGNFAISATPGQVLSSNGTTLAWANPGAASTGTYLTSTNMTSTLPNSTNLAGVGSGLMFNSVAGGTTATVTASLGASGTVPRSNGTAVVWTAMPTIQKGVATLSAGANPSIPVSATSVLTSPESTIIVTPIFVGAPVPGNVLQAYASNYDPGVGFTLGIYGTIASDLKVSWMVVN